MAVDIKYKQLPDLRQGVVAVERTGQILKHVPFIPPTILWLYELPEFFDRA
jgi:hypothetical protein